MREGGFPVDAQVFVDEGLLGIWQGGLADVKHAAVLQGQRSCGQAVGGEQAAQGFPVAQVAAVPEGFAHPAQEVVGEHGDEDVALDAVFELVEVWAQAEGSLGIAPNRPQFFSRP